MQYSVGNRLFLKDIKNSGVSGLEPLFGSRLAGGCTLGLFISGSTQLAFSGLYFGVIIFAVAILTARLIFGKVAEQEEI